MIKLSYYIWKGFLFSASSLEITHFLLGYSLLQAHAELLSAVSAVVCTARNAHLDCVRTSLNTLQLTRTARQLLSRPWWDSIIFVYHVLSHTSIQRVNHMVGVTCRDSLIIFFTEFNLLVFASLLVSLQHKFISVGKAVLNMHQGYLGHVMHVTKATGGAYIACTVCFTRVLGCTCWLDPEIMLEQWKCVSTVYCGC